MELLAILIDEARAGNKAAQAALLKANIRRNLVMDLRPLSNDALRAIRKTLIRESKGIDLLLKCASVNDKGSLRRTQRDLISTISRINVILS